MTLVSQNVMETCIGTFVDPLALRFEEVSIDQIAHSLSLQCRFRGHCKAFYSVAEHCCHVHDLAMHWWEREIRQNKLSEPSTDRNLMLWALLHDAGETWLGDIHRPLKRRLPEIEIAEDRLTFQVLRRFSVNPTAGDRALVELFDDVCLWFEASQLMPSRGKSWQWKTTVTEAILSKSTLAVTVQNWRPEQARFEFLERFIRWEK